MSDTQAPDAWQDCPDDNQLQLYLEQALSPALQASLDEHIEGCEICAEVLLALAELLVPSGHPVADEFGYQRGHQVGRYTLVGLLGKGGMGAVYEGFDEQLQRRVALKMIRPDALDGNTGALLKERMLREARALAGISHPHILPVYEIGEWREELFIAMQLVEGDDLRTWLVRHRPPWATIVTIFVQATRGLQAAHDAGIIHRDVKPDNFLITADNHVYLADFGLVSNTPDINQSERLPTHHETRLTMTGMVVGTHGYLAPELYRGQPADPLSDQFALCVALFEALYQQLPHVSLPLADHLQALETGVLRTPLVDDVPSKFYELLERGLHPIPTKRFASMEALRSELERELEAAEGAPTRPEQPVHASFSHMSLDDLPALPSGPNQPTSRLWLALAMLACLVLGGGAVLIVLQTGALRQQQTSISPKRRATSALPAKVRNIPRVRPTRPAPIQTPDVRETQPTHQVPRRRVPQAKAPPMTRRSKARRPYPMPRRRIRRARRSRRNLLRSRRLLARRLRARRLRVRPRPPRRRHLARRPVHRRAIAGRAGSLDWWTAKLPHNKAYICWTSEQTIRKMGGLQGASRDNIDQRHAWVRHARCLFQVGSCRRGLRTATLRRKYTSMRPRSGLNQERAYEDAAHDCPLRSFITQVSPLVTRYAKSIGPDKLRRVQWCRQYLSRLISRKTRRAGRLSSTYQRRWKKLLWALARCYYQRAVRFQGRTQARSACRWLRRKLKRANTKLRTRILSAQEFRRQFPACF